MPIAVIRLADEWRAGNLFVVGSTQPESNILAELSQGKKRFTNISVDQPFYLGQVQWDGQNLAVQGDRNHIYRVQVSDSSGTVIQKVPFWDSGRFGIIGFWIQGNVVAITGWNLGLWHYPQGRKPFQMFTAKAHRFSGVTVSVVPSGSHNRR